MQGFLNPSKVLEELQINKQMVAADFGSGSGGWAIPLAKILQEGKVFAVDIQDEPLSALQSKAKLEKLFNIEVFRGNVEERTKILSGSCDLVLMTNILFESKNKRKILEEAMRVLKTGGKILVVDRIEGAVMGPEENVQSEEIKKIAQDLGLKIEKEFRAGAYHWALILEE